MLASSVDGQLKSRKIKTVAKVVQLKDKAMVYWIQIAVMMIDIYRQVACDDVTSQQWPANVASNWWILLAAWNEDAWRRGCL